MVRTANAFASPHLYRTMFDTEAELDDPDAPDASFADLVTCAARARRSGRFSPRCDPQALATQFWTTGHGLIMLALTGMLPSQAVAALAPTVATALFVAAGDDKTRRRRSVRAG